MIKEIQAIVERQIRSSSPCDIVIGTLRSQMPIEIEIEGGIVLKKSELLLCGVLLPREINTNHSHMISTEDGVLYTGGQIPNLGEITVSGIGIGDPVLLIKAAGGQKYALLSRLIEPD